MAGFFKVYRDQVNDDFIKNPFMLQVWIFLCRQARYQQTVQDGIELQPGQLLISAKEIAHGCNQTEDKVKYNLQRLTQLGMIRRENIRYRCSLITILTPDEQSEPQDTPAVAPSPQPAVSIPPVSPAQSPAPKQYTPPPASPKQYTPYPSAQKQYAPSAAALKQELPDNPASYDLELAEYIARTSVQKLKKRNRH